jgi:hypothetical protein
MAEIVGEVDMASRFRVEQSEVQDWAARGLLPAPEGQVAGFHAWRWVTVRDWARRTGRFDLEGAVVELLRQRLGGWNLPTICDSLAAGGIFTEVAPEQVTRTLEDLLEGDMVSKLPGDCWSALPEPMY